MTIRLKNHQGLEKEIRTGPSLKAFLQEKYQRTDSHAIKRYLSSEGVQLKEVIRALGIEELGKQQVRTLLSNDGTKPLFNAVVEDGLRIGFEKEANWQSLIIKDIPQDQMSGTFYYLDSDEDEVQLRDVGQGAPIPVGTIKVGDKSYKMHKRGRGIEWTDESKSANIDLVSLWFMKLGKKLGRDYENTAVYRLLNGYFPDGYDAAPTIGVKTANTLTLGDLFYAVSYMDSDLGFTAKRLIVNLKTAAMIAELKNGDNNYLFIDSLKKGEWPSPLKIPMHINNLVPDNRVILVDTSFALNRHVYKSFGVEFERSAKTQVEGSYGTEISEFIPFEKNARLIITIDSARS
jgi:hypothetical protein